jgi:hypothetical protein
MAEITIRQKRKSIPKDWYTSSGFKKKKIKLIIRWLSEILDTMLVLKPVIINKEKMAIAKNKCTYLF